MRKTDSQPRPSGNIPLRATNGVVSHAHDAPVQGGLIRVRGESSARRGTDTVVFFFLADQGQLILILFRALYEINKHDQRSQVVF